MKCLILFQEPFILLSADSVLLTLTVFLQSAVQKKEKESCIYQETMQNIIIKCVFTPICYLFVSSLEAAQQSLTL